LQAVINAANATTLGAKGKQNYIPTPDAIKSKGINYDELYPRVFSQPATYIRFSSTVEDSIGVPYCMDDEDVDFLAKLNDGKDADGRDREDKLSQCSEDTFEEVMNFFEDTSTRVQPFANVDNAPILSLDEMEHSVDESISVESQKWLPLIYNYWVLKQGSRSLMPSIKVRVLDTGSEADDADPYVCFRRREVRQTRKTRGRDAQVVEKLKKLRLELEQARQLVSAVVQREQLHKENLETSRKVFEQRRQLKEVKVGKGIVGEKGDDEDLLVNQKVRSPHQAIVQLNLLTTAQPVAKSKYRQDTAQQRPPTIRLRSGGDRPAPDNDLPLLDDSRAEAEAHVTNTIESRKDQHKRWNHGWEDATWAPLTPPEEHTDPMQKWAQFPPAELDYPTPPPSLPSQTSQTSQDGDVQMQDVEEEKDAVGGAGPEPEFIFHIPGAYPVEPEEHEVKREAHPACRLRYGRGGRCHLESRKRKARGYISRGVVSDTDSDEDDGPVYFPISDRIVFEYRAALNNRSRPEGSTGERRQLSSADQGATAGAVGGNGHPSPSLVQRQNSSGAAG